MSDYTFKFRSHEGAGLDWPISYADIAPYYENVERFLGVVGNDDGIEYCPSGSYVRPAGLSKPEQHFKLAVEGALTNAKVMAWRYVRKEPRRWTPSATAPRRRWRPPRPPAT